MTGSDFSTCVLKPVLAEQKIRMGKSKNFMIIFSKIILVKFP